MDEQRACIRVAAEHAKLKLVSDAFAVEKTIKEIVCCFEFRTNDWDNLTKTAVFIKEGDKNASPILIVLGSENSCDVPTEVLESNGEFSIGVFGVDATHRLPTNLINFKIHKGCYVSGTTPGNPTQSVYEQIIAMIQGLNDYSEEEIKTFAAEYLTDNNYVQKSYVDSHINDNVRHITVTERSNWNAKAEVSDIPTNVSELSNDSGYLTQQSLANYTTKQYVDAKVGEIPVVDISGQINTHNVSTTAHADLFAGKANITDGTVISDNADFAEIGEWYDGNSSNENRVGHFVTLKKEIEGFVIDKANATSDVCGVIVESPAFSGNADDKYDTAGNLLPKYDYVALLGLVSVIDNGECTAPGKCMPAADGTAVPSTNNMGFNVISRIDETHIEVFIRPGADMLQRIKADILELESSKQDVISDLDNIRSSANLGSTAYQKPADGISESDLSDAVKEKFDKSYTHNQRVAGSVWNITHNLGKYPAASTVDSGGNIVVGEVLYINENELQITFSAPFSGKCYLN